MQDPKIQTNQPVSPPTTTVAPTKEVVPVPGPNDNFALASLILGIVSLFVSLIPYIGLLFSFITIIFGFKGKDSQIKYKLAKIGIILGFLGLISSIFWWLLSLYVNILPTL